MVDVLATRSDGATGSGRALPWLGELRLVERVGQRSWLVAVDGAPIAGVGRPMAEPVPPGADPAELVGRFSRLAGDDDPTLVPVAGLGSHRGRLWLVSAADGGVDLGRFLDVVRPSPAQALLLAEDLLSGLRYLHATGRSHGRLHPTNVQVGADGVARLGDWALPRPDPDRWKDLRRADLVDAAATVRQLSVALRCPANARREDTRLLAGVPGRLRSTTRPDALAEVTAQLRAWNADPTVRGDLREELVSLVAAAGPRPAPGSGGAAGAGAGRRAMRVVGDGEAHDLPQTGPPPVEAQRWRPPGRQASEPGSGGVHRLARSAVGLALATAVLGLLVGLEITFLNGPITRDLRALRSPAPAASPAPGAAAAAPKVGSALPAGPIRAIDVRPVQPCVPGRACLVRLLVGTAPHSAPIAVAWHLRIYDQCSTSSVGQAGGTSQLAANDTQLTRLVSVALPWWKSSEVVAQLSAPVDAASTPLPVPTSGGSCP